ncbi:ABC transporter ATP-binding protein [Vallitalea pronyensis]|uniref:ABC transporter ATP-binding protein n=1 Tax=Vallitalea pronyensis TaxID=1348613 RepID=A0A8J8MPS9_9FIRM|nr:ABC transporter ATP-binding protein [Vallitalea pronyensis]QUI25326.1 ABC transporter ATP-binding protein [Vallitalea pronyensis]
MIHIKDVNIAYGDDNIIQGINLRFKKNSITAIIGESGTGKTSLGLGLMGLSKGQISGNIIVNGQNILEYSKEKMKEYRWNTTSIVFQNTGDLLNPTVNILEQVKESMISHGYCSIKEAIQRSIALLLQVGISESYHLTYPAQLSGGQIQKVLLAMALANDPEVLILDEPTSALDPLTKQDMIQLIKKVAADKTVILITHDFSVSRSLAEDVVVLYGGHVVEQGAASKILTIPKHPYTRGLLRAYPNMSTTKDLQGIRGHIQPSQNGCPFANRCTQKQTLCSKEIPKLRDIQGRMIACHRGGIMSLLRGENITKKYQKTTVLKALNFNVYEGESLAVVGESGSGKTTLAKCIMGLEEMNSGKLFYCGKEVRHHKAFYKQVQIIYQNPLASINRHFDTLRAVKEPLDIFHMGTKEQKREKVLDALEEVHLPTDERFLRRVPYELSGGESQRVAIARALILQPKLLIADEATSALDVSVQAKIMKLFMELQEKRGLTLLFITHNIALARKISDKMLVLKDGEIIESGHSAIITHTPNHPYTKNLIQAAPQIF